MMAPERLCEFLRDVRLGALTRRGYTRFSLAWLGRPLLRAQKADAEAAERLGLLTFNGRIGDVTAELTTAGRSLLEVLK